MPDFNRPADQRNYVMDGGGLAVCRICKCSELDACEGGCCWVERDLCDCCGMMVATLAAAIGGYLGAAGPRADRDKRAALLDALQVEPGGAPPSPETITAAVEFLSAPVLVAVGEAMAALCAPETADSLIVLPG